MNTLKQYFLKIKEIKSNPISILLLVALPIFFVLGVLPNYSYTGRELMKHLFGINYGFSLAFTFLAVVIPLIVFADIYYFTLAIDFSHLEKEAKQRGSYLPIWYKISIFSFLYSLMLLLIVYFAVPSVIRGTHISFNMLFPYPAISFILYPIIYLLAALFVSGIILIFIRSSYTYYILLAGSIVFNVILIGIFNTVLLVRILYETVLTIIAVLAVSDLFLKIKLSEKYNENVSKTE